MGCSSKLTARRRVLRGAWNYTCSTNHFRCESVGTTHSTCIWEDSASAAIAWVVALFVVLPAMVSFFPLDFPAKLKNEKKSDNYRQFWNFLHITWNSKIYGKIPTFLNYRKFWNFRYNVIKNSGNSEISGKNAYKNTGIFEIFSKNLKNCFENFEISDKSLIASRFMLKVWNFRYHYGGFVICINSEWILKNNYKICKINIVNSLSLWRCQT